jgi:hypothetical protein
MKDATHIICIVDQSSSMGIIQGQAVEGFNKFLNEQKAQPGAATFQLTLFDYPGYNEAYKGDLKDAPEMSLGEQSGKILYSPRGCTALLDAVGKTVNSAGAWLSEMPEHDRPNKVLCVILTDGEENSSKEFDNHKIAEMVAHQRDKYNWEFLFLGANIDSWHAANMMGIGRANAVNFVASGKGVQQAYAVSNLAARQYRACGQSVSHSVAKTTDDSGYIDQDKLDNESRTDGTSSSAN